MLKTLNIVNKFAPKASSSFTRSYTTQVTAKTWDELVKNAKKPVVVDFYAPWCAPCRTLLPQLEKAVSEHEGVQLYQLNIDEEPSLAEKHNVSSIPYVVGFSNGAPVFNFTGAIPASQINKYLAQFNDKK